MKKRIKVKLTNCASAIRLYNYLSERWHFEESDLYLTFDQIIVVKEIGFVQDIWDGICSDDVDAVNEFRGIEIDNM
jgi:hypothetical protein